MVERKQTFPGKISGKPSSISQAEGLSANEVKAAFQATIDVQGEFQMPSISDDEMRQMTIPDALTEIERCKLLLSKHQDPIQQAYVFQNARNIFSQNPDQIQDLVIPVLLRSINQMTEQNQIQAGEMLDMLIRTKIIQSNNLIFLIDKTADEMTQNWNESVLAVWLKVKACCVTDKQEMQDIISSLCQGSQPVAVKCAACVLMANLLDNNQDMDLSSQIKVLSQDFIWKVRFAVAENIENIPMPIDQKSKILDVLTQDEERDVAMSSANAIAKIIINKKEFILFQKYLKLVQSGLVRPQVAMEKLPQVLSVVVQKKPLLLEQVGTQILDVLRKMSQQEYDRQLCAYSMLDFGKAYKDKFIGTLYKPFYQKLIDTELQSTTDLGCKVQLAETIMPVCLLYTSDQRTEEVLQNQIIGLMKFANSLVMQRLMEGLIQNTKEKAPQWCKVNKILVHIMKTLSPAQKTVIQRNWRVQRDIILVIAQAMMWQKQDTKIIEEILNYLLNRHNFYEEFLPSLPAKQALADSLAFLLTQKLPVPDMRGKINQNMLKNYGKAKSSQLRIVWVLFIQSLMQKISAKLFDEVYGTIVLEIMKGENVGSLACQYVKLIPEMSRRLKRIEMKQKLAAVVKYYKSTRFQNNKKVQEELLVAFEQVRVQESGENGDNQSQIEKNELWIQSDQLLEKRDYQTMVEEQKAGSTHNQGFEQTNNQKLKMTLPKQMQRKRSSSRSNSQNRQRLASSDKKKLENKTPMSAAVVTGFGSVRITPANNALAPQPKSARNKK